MESVAGTPPTGAPRPSTARGTRGEGLGGVRLRPEGLDAVGV
jgi:hypothetical protein